MQTPFLFSHLPRGVKLSAGESNLLLRQEESQLFRLVGHVDSLDLSQIPPDLFIVLVNAFKREANFVPLLVQCILQSGTSLVVSEVSKLVQFVSNSIGEKGDLGPLIAVLFKVFPALFKNSVQKWREFVASQDAVDPILFVSFLQLVAKAERRELVGEKTELLVQLVRTGLLSGIQSNFSKVSLNRLSELTVAGTLKHSNTSVDGISSLLNEAAKVATILCHAFHAGEVEVDLEFIVVHLICSLFSLVKEQTIASSMLPESVYSCICNNAFPQLHLIACKLTIQLLSSASATSSAHFFRVKNALLTALFGQLRLYSEHCLMRTMLCNCLQLCTAGGYLDSVSVENVRLYLEAALACWPQCSLQPFYPVQEVHEGLWSWIFAQCTTNSNVSAVASELLWYCSTQMLHRVIPLVKATFPFEERLYQVVNVLARRNKFADCRNANASSELSGIRFASDETPISERTVAQKEAKEEVQKEAKEKTLSTSDSMQIPTIDFE